MTIAKKSIKQRVTERAERAIKEALKSDVIEYQIKAFANQHLGTVIGSALGFKKDAWHGWQLSSDNHDHPIYKLIRARAEEIITTTFAPAIENFAVKLRRADLNNAREVMQDAYEHRLVEVLFNHARDEGYRQAEADAKAILAKLVDNVVGEDT